MGDAEAAAEPLFIRGVAARSSGPADGDGSVVVVSNIAGVTRHDNATPGRRVRSHVDGASKILHTKPNAMRSANMPPARAIDIVKTYADEGKSGLSIDGRAALKSLIEDVERGRAEFETILVYDVSRWGRFQDADESAYYEYICKRAGITVQYCAEQFENDGSPISTIVKSVKRAMAGEYS